MRDLHVHTYFSDGLASPEEMLQSALSLGMDCIGFSDHSHSPQPDGGWSMRPGTEEAYREEIGRLKRKYAGKITVLCGTEQDLYSDTVPEGYDYYLGAMHYIRVPGGNDLFIPVDSSAEELRRGTEEYFGGDPYALCEAYYDQLGRLPELLPGCDIIAHFDLISKFQEKTPLFDENDPRYIAAWKRAADRLLRMNIPFEINTGAISRGWRTTPYPAESIRKYIREKGGRMLLSSDSHQPDTLCYRFDLWRQEAGE